MQVPSPRHWTREDPNPESPSGPTKFCTTWLYAARHSILTFSLVSSKKWKLLRLFVTARTIQSMESPGQNTGVGSLSLLQGIFPTQGSNPGLPHCRWILFQLSHKGSPRILEWVAYLFSSRSSWPRNQTSVSCVAGGFFTNWAIKEAPDHVGDALI